MKQQQMKLEVESESLFCSIMAFFPIAMRKHVILESYTKYYSTKRYIKLRFKLFNLIINVLKIKGSKMKIIKDNYV